MNSEEFIKAVQANEISGDVEKVNTNYRRIVCEYINDNSPCKVGIPYILDDVGVRVEFEKHKTKNRAFLIDLLDVEYKPNGEPLIMAFGNVYVNGNNIERYSDIVGTFKCIIHGSAGKLKFKKFSKIISS